MLVNTLFNSPYRDLLEFGFFVSIGLTAGSMGLL